MAAGDLVAGRYRLVRSLGTGAMGQVWLADDELLHRQIALKQLLFDPETSDQADLDRAMREARLASQLSHPNAVSVYDLLVDGGRPMLVMEYVSGQSLAHRLRDGARIPAAEAATLMAEVASALATAHGLGIVHRDVKPANILIAADGRAKLADFGIARSGADATLTATGMIVGTVAYLAPELAQGGAATPASDMWSLGATFFAAVEGTAPITGRSAVEVLLRLVRDPIPEPVHAGRFTGLITELLTREPTARPTAATVVEWIHGELTGVAATKTTVLAAATSDTALTRRDPPAEPTVQVALREPGTSSAGRHSGAKRPRRVRVWLLVVLAVVVLAGAATGAYFGLRSTGHAGPPTGHTPNAGTIYVANAHNGSVSVIGPHASTDQRITMHSGPNLMAIAPFGTPNAGTVYVSNSGDSLSGNTVSVIGPHSSHADTIQVGNGPTAIAIAPAGTVNAGTVYVANTGPGNAGNTVSVIKPNSMSVKTVTVQTGPKGIAVAPYGTPNAGTVYVSNTASASVSEIDPRTLEVTNIAVGAGPAAIVIAPAHTPRAGSVYIAHLGTHTNGANDVVSVLGPKATVPIPIAVGVAPLGMAVAPAGTPNAGSVYVTNSQSDTVSVMSPRDNSVVTIEVSGGPAGVDVAPAGTPDAGTAYVAIFGNLDTRSKTPTGGGSSVVTIKPGATTTSSTIPVQPDPYNLTIAPIGTPNAGTVYVTDGDIIEQTGNMISVIRPGADSSRSIVVGNVPASVIVAP